MRRMIYFLVLAVIVVGFILIIVGVATPAERLIVRPGPGGGFIVRNVEPLSHPGWSGTLPAGAVGCAWSDLTECHHVGGRHYEIKIEPTVARKAAYAQVQGAGHVWVAAEAVCPDADWLMRLSRACRRP